MLKLGDRVLQQGVPFKHDGIQYAANWLQLSTWEEKQAIGITEEPDPIPEPVVPPPPPPKPTLEEKLAAVGLTLEELRTALAENPE